MEILILIFYFLRLHASHSHVIFLSFLRLFVRALTIHLSRQEGSNACSFWRSKIKYTNQPTNILVSLSLVVALSDCACIISRNLGGQFVITRIILVIFSNGWTSEVIQLEVLQQHSRLSGITLSIKPFVQLMYWARENAYEQNRFSILQYTYLVEVTFRCWQKHVFYPKKEKEIILFPKLWYETYFWGNIWKFKIKCKVNQGCELFEKIKNRWDSSSVPYLS